jgi:hypothetical protein
MQVFSEFASLAASEALEIREEGASAGSSIDSALPVNPRVPYFRIECPSAVDGSVERVMVITPTDSGASMSRMRWNVLQRIPR